MTSAGSLWELLILHTNDSHGHFFPFDSSHPDISAQLRWCASPVPRCLGGFAYLASVVREIRAQKEEVLFFDAGDFLADTMIANLSKGQVNLTAMDILGYAAVTPGNHDIDYGVDTLKQRAREASFPFLAANLLDEGTGKPLLGDPYFLTEFHDTKIGVYGLTYHLTPETTAKENIEGARYSLNFNQIAGNIQELRDKGAQIVIILSHLGSSVDEKLAQEVSGVDVIIGGHSHDPIGLRNVNGVVITQATPYFSGLGYLSLTIENGKISGASGREIPIIPGQIEPNPFVEGFLQHARGEYAEQLDRPVGVALAPVITNYKKESPADTFFGNILRATTGSQISILPGRGFGLTLPEGVITDEMLTNLLPHESPIYSGHLLGRDIKAALEQSVYNQINPDVTQRVGGLIQVTGVSFEYTFSNVPGNLVRNVRVNDLPLQEDAYYSVVMNQLMYEGGHKYESLTNITKVHKWGLNDKEMIIQWLRNDPLFKAQEGGWSNPLAADDVRESAKKCFPL